MSLHDDVKAVLATAPAVTAVFANRVYTWDETGGFGLSRATLPGAFDANRTLLRTLIIKERDQIATNAVRDEQTRSASVVQAAELWFYTNRADFAGIIALKGAQHIAYTLLADRNLLGSGGRLVFREHRQSNRERDLDNAFYVLSVYDLHTVIHS